MKQRSKRGNTNRWVADVFAKFGGRKWQESVDRLRKEADHFDKVAMKRKKAQRKHLQKVRGNS